MKKLIVLLVFAVTVITACKSKEEKLTEDVEKVITTWYKVNYDSLNMFEKIEIVGIDTLTPKDKLRKDRRYNLILATAQRGVVEEFIKEMNDSERKYYLMLGVSSNLCRIYKNDYLKYKDNALEQLSEYEKIMEKDSILNSKINNPKEDSTTLLAYTVTCNIKAHNKDMTSANIDSLIFYISKEMKIIKISDL